MCSWRDRVKHSAEQSNGELAKPRIFFPFLVKRGEWSEIQWGDDGGMESVKVDRGEEES